MPSKINKQEIETISGGQVAQNVYGNQVQNNQYIENKISINNTVNIDLKLLELSKTYPFFFNYNIVRVGYENYIINNNNSKCVLYLDSGWNNKEEKIYIASRNASSSEKKLCEIKKRKEMLSGWETPYDFDFINLFYSSDLNKILQEVKIYLFELDNNIIDWEKELWNSINKDIEKGEAPF